MELTLSQYASVAAVVFASSAVQCSVGFAAGLFGIPLLMLVGLTLPEAISASLVGAMVLNSYGALRLRHEVPLELLLRPAIVRLVTLPIGVLALLWLSESLDRDVTKQVVGGILLMVLLVQRVLRAEPREIWHWGWEILTFSASGFLLGFCGMGGSVMVVWVMAHKWSALKSRAFLFAMFMSAIVPHIGLLFWCFGREMVQPMIAGLLAIPVMFLGAAVGLKIGNMMPKARLRRVAYTLLYIIAITAIVTPFLSTKTVSSSAF